MVLLSLRYAIATLKIKINFQLPLGQKLCYTIHITSKIMLQAIHSKFILFIIDLSVNKT